MRGGRDDARALLSAVGSGVGTAVWYALPDHVASRQRRALAKAGLAGAILVWSLLTRPTLPQAVSWAGGPSGEPARSDLSRRGGRTGAVVGAIAAGLALAAAGETALFRLGERSARRGATLPHTRNSLVLGAVGAVFALSVDRAARAGAATPS